MNDTGKKLITAIDHSKIKEGQSIFKGDIYDADDNLIGPAPIKGAFTNQEAEEKIEPINEPPDLEEFGDNAEDFKDEFMDDKKEGCLKISSHLIKKYHVKTIRGLRMREAFIYKDGIYIPGEDVLRKEVRELLEEQCTIHYTKEIIEAIKELTADSRERFQADINLINLQNGIFNLQTGELMPHGPQHIFFTKIPVNYDPTIDCPAIKKFLHEILDEDQIKIIQEWFGYTLYREYPIKKAIIFVGEGDTGKTTLISLETIFVGLENTSGVSLQKISSDKFAASNLYNKHANIYDDLSAYDIKDNGIFKIATGGGFITGEKKFGDQFQFKNYTKLTFACNKIPDVKDTTDDAYFKRWLIIQFSLTVAESRQDKTLIHKLTTPTELSGLFNFAKEGLQRLLKNQRFSYEKDADEIKIEMMRSGSPIVNFIYDCLETIKDEWISKENMYKAYAEYARSAELPVESMSAFGRALPKYATYLSDFKPSDPKTGKQVTAWGNVQLRQKPGFPYKEEPKQLSLQRRTEATRARAITVVNIMDIIHLFNPYQSLNNNQFVYLGMNKNYPCYPRYSYFLPDIK